ncbi:MarR family winged helix-turn-helix transcriptional regulator [Leucobacter sp. PH1c]|uniref:MarR family winged helix-turn-helix transcriptional regulator n=1 Tax=Leucobacter sp. PH1c TaxID=1397278 RepID=UPI00046ABEEA|nr:MarR family winged helix-turn-helix transcriptional regulator [Leucobacter sp. PH1c]
MTTPAPRMTEQESNAWLGLVTVSQLLPNVLDAQLLRDSQMTHFEFTVLSSLYVAPEATLQMSHLARETAATLPRLSHVCTRMEKRGLLERVPCPDDRRATNARLTSLGRRAFIRAIPQHIELVRELVIDALSSEELDALGAISAKINARLAERQG